MTTDSLQERFINSRACTIQRCVFWSLQNGTYNGDDEIQHDQKHDDVVGELEEEEPRIVRPRRATNSAALQHGAQHHFPQSFKRTFKVLEQQSARACSKLAKGHTQRPREKAQTLLTPCTP